METLKFYLVYIPVFIVLTIVLLKWLKPKDNEYRYKVLLVFAGLALVLHVTKIFFFPYNTHVFPNILRKSTLENVCAFGAVAYLFILISKNKIAIDYMMIVGMLGGLAAFLYPTEVILGLFDSMPVSYKLTLISYDTIRFYVVHYLLFIIPFIMYYFKMHKLEMKRVIYLPITVLLMMTIVYLNEVLLRSIGWLDDVNNFFGRDIFFDRNIRNSSFVFGLPDNFMGVGRIFNIFVPKFLRPNNNYIPVVWFIIPSVIWGFIFYSGFAFVTNRKETIEFFTKK